MRLQAAAIPQAKGKTLRGSILQRKCACGQHTGGGECQECRKKKQMVQRQRVNNSEPASVPAIVHEVLRSPGQRLTPDVKGLMELRFGRDFSHVRIHQGPQAVASVRAVGALAYTVGRDIVFGAGQYAPLTRLGKRLIAHELTHVAQQGAREATQGDLILGSPESPHESEADRIAASLGADSMPGPTRPASLAAISPDVGPVLRRWKIAGKIATAEDEDDYLGRLAEKLGTSFNDWKCIQPIEMKTFKTPGAVARYGSRYERFVQVGDTFDISNLTATKGETLRLHMFSNSPKNAGIAQLFYPGITATVGAEGDIENVAHSGAKPISDFLIFGHASEDEMFGDGVSFKPADSKPEEPEPSYNLAKEGLLPQRCWFTRTATCRSVGCNSQTWGNDFAAAFLRKGATVTTTTKSVRPKCQGLPLLVGTAQRILGGCAWYNGLDFATGFTIPSTTLDGPFWSVGDFHAGRFWTAIKGKL